MEHKPENGRASTRLTKKTLSNAMEVFRDWEADVLPHTDGGSAWSGDVKRLLRRLAKVLA